MRYTDPSGHIIRVSGSENDQQIILAHLQQLTDHKLMIKDGQVWIGELGDMGNLRYEQGNKLLARMMLDDNTTTIVVQTKEGNYEVNDNNKNAINGVGSDATVYFNPKSNPTIQTTDPETGNVSGQKRPSYVGLAHELIHADRAMRGAQYDYKTMGSYIYQIDKKAGSFLGMKYTDTWRKRQTIRKEELATTGLRYVRNGDITENKIRAEHGLPLRGAY